MVGCTNPNDEVTNHYFDILRYTCVFDINKR